jgi:signal transduction histidine kinase
VLRFINKSFANKIMAAVIISISLVMGAEIMLRIYFGTRDRLELMRILNVDLAESTYAGIKYPMSVGDSEAVKKVLSAVRTKMYDVEVLICDFNQEVIWSTHVEKERTRIANWIPDTDILTALKEILETGEDTDRSFDTELHGVRHLVTIQPILNQQDCYHCHGSTRKVIGGMVIGTDVQRTYATVIAARNRTILISIVGIAAIIILLYVMSVKFVGRPLQDLTESAKRFADGESTVLVDVKTSDEIGVLGNSFNYMVQRISAFSEKLEEEVAKKTDLLSERAKLIALLERANSQLRELDRLKSTFLANMSHELRTPMNSIIGYSDLLLDGVDGPLNEEQGDSLEKISRNADHLLKLINDILDLSKIESGKIVLEPTWFSLKDLVQSLIPFFEPMTNKKGLTIGLKLDEKLPLVYADEDKIKHVLMNLISNAVRFTEEGRITVSARVSDRGIQAGETPIFAEVCVEDTGIGIRDEELGKIFNKFVQADLSTVRQHEGKGTGLGLSIARGLVALHKGMIWATSRFGEGSQFYFTVPLKQEILDVPSRPVTERKVADALAEYFGRPVGAFLREPQYAGKKVRCWEFVHCGEPSCPAYGSQETRCWLVLGTHCAGLRIAAYPEKVDFCKSCEVVQRLVLSSEAVTSDGWGATANGDESAVQHGGADPRNTNY